MTHVGPTPVTETAAVPRGSFVEWSAVLAGAVLASALSFVLLTFGAAIGLSATSPWPNAGTSATVLGVLALLFTMVQQIGSFMAGGYVAGRMRSRWQGTPQDEVEFRDGLHGGLVWAVGIAIGAALLLATAGGAARTAADVAGKMAAKADPMEVVIDTMLRSANVAQAAPQGGAQQGAQAARTPPPGTANVADTRAEMSRIITSSLATGSMSQQDRAYLAQIVAQRTGVPQPEAEKRVNDAFNAAREAANKARRAAVVTGFVTAAGLIISFGAAWWAALQGGRHRDNSVPARFEFAGRMRQMYPPRSR